MAPLTLRVGYDLIYECPAPTPMMLMLHIHHERAADIIEADLMQADPFIPAAPYRDGFGNWCTRILAPTGRLRLSARALLRDSGEPDPIAVAGEQHPVEELPEDVVVYLLGSRYCETDRLTEAAWDLFGRAPAGAARVQAICDYVHRHITFNYQDARATRTAWEAMQERKGVCRDYAHLAVALCRCMNIPARYCTGYLTDIGVEPPYGPMDSRPGSRPTSAGAGTPSTPATTAAHRPRADGARPRRHRRGHQHHVRHQHAGGVYGLG